MTFPESCPPLNLPTTGSSSVDWNKNTMIDSNPLINYNINSINTINGKVVCQEPTTQQLPGFWDTNALVFNIRSDGDWADGRPAESLDQLAPVLEEDIEMNELMESPFCLPPQIILDSILEANPTASTEEQLDHFNNTRSCAGGRGETDLNVIRDAYLNATMPTGVSISSLGIPDHLQSIPSDDDELTPDDAISMRLSRIDSISEYLYNKFPTPRGSIALDPTVQFYTPKLVKIKMDISDHKLLDVLKGLQNLYDSYQNNITDNVTRLALQSGTADIYASINKAALGPPLSKVPSVGGVSSVVFDIKTGYVDLPGLKLAHPELFDDDGVLVENYKNIRKNGNFLIDKWEIVKEGDKIKDNVKYLKPLKMLKLVDKIDVVCNQGLVKVSKPDGKSVICVKESTAKKLNDMWLK